MDTDRTDQDSQNPSGPDQVGGGASFDAGQAPPGSEPAGAGQQGPPSEASGQPDAHGGPGGNGQPGQAGGGPPPGGDPGRRPVLKYGAVALAALGGWFVYDSGAAGDATIDRSTPRATLRTNIRGYREEDIELVRATMHPDSRAYDSTIEQSRELFDEYELEYELTIHDVRTAGESAEADVTQTTRKVSGPSFRDNRLTATHELRTYEGNWRIYDSTVDDVEYI